MSQYETPWIEALEAEAEQVLCQSAGIPGQTLPYDDYGDL